MNRQEYLKMRKQAWEHYQEVKDPFIVKFSKHFDAKIVAFERRKKR